MNKFYLFLTTILLCGCQEMGRDYFIGGKYAFSDNKIIKCVDHQSKIAETETVIGYAVQTYNFDENEDYIIAYQTNENGDERRIDNFWIIDVKNDKIHGPMNIKQFKQLKQKLGIELKFDRSIGSTRWREGHLQIEQ